MKIRFFLPVQCFILLFFISACGSRDGFSSSTEWITETPTYYPSLTPILPVETSTLVVPTFTSTATPTLTIIPTSPPVDKSENLCESGYNFWSCTCGDLSVSSGWDGYSVLEMKKSNQPGWCDITMPKRGYKILLPDGWYCRVVGYFENVLDCTNKASESFQIDSFYSEIPIEIADQAVKIFSEGGSTSYTAVMDGENVFKKELASAGGRQVVRVLSAKNEQGLLRYFLKNGNRLFVFKMEASRIENIVTFDNKVFVGPVAFIEQVIRSMRFTE